MSRAPFPQSTISYDLGTAKLIFAIIDGALLFTTIYVTIFIFLLGPPLPTSYHLLAALLSVYAVFIFALIMRKRWAFCFGYLLAFTAFGLGVYIILVPSYHGFDSMAQLGADIFAGALFFPSIPWLLAMPSGIHEDTLSRHTKKE